MKELSIEQKAKAYDEKLDVARHIYADPSVKDEDKYYIEVIFPELAESKDAKIRKEIIATIHLYYGEPLENKAKEMIAWLENQGEQKPADKVEPKFKAGDTIRLKNSTAEYTIESISGGWYHGKGWGLNIIDADKSGNYELVEQKPAWSEADVNRINRLIAYFEDKESFTAEDDVAYANWLESLKDRVLPQPKQEWSEEDEIYISDVLWCVEQARKVAKDENDMGTTWCAERWLKSLKNRYTWKPSDKQMKALNEAVYHVDDSVATQIAMLIGELSKL